MKTIEHRLKSIRKNLNLTQAGFAQRLNMTDAMISMLEAGKKPLIDKNINLICLTFGIREEWLRNGTGDMFDEEDDPLTDEIMEIVARLTPEMKALVLEYVKFMVNQQKILHPAAEEAGLEAKLA